MARPRAAAQLSTAVVSQMRPTVSCAYTGGKSGSLVNCATLVPLTPNNARSSAVAITGGGHWASVIATSVSNLMMHRYHAHIIHGNHAT